MLGLVLVGRTRVILRPARAAVTRRRAPCVPRRRSEATSPCPHCRNRDSRRRGRTSSISSSRLPGVIASQAVEGLGITAGRPGDIHRRLRTVCQVIGDTEFRGRVHEAGEEVARGHLHPEAYPKESGITVQWVHGNQAHRKNSPQGQRANGVRVAGIADKSLSPALR